MTSVERSSLLNDDDRSPRSRGSGRSSHRRSSPRSPADHDFDNYYRSVSGGSKNNDSRGSGSNGRSSRHSSRSRSTATPPPTSGNAYAGAPIESPGTRTTRSSDDPASRRYSYDTSRQGDVVKEGFKKLSNVERRMAEVEMYAAIARKKASLMTNHDFERVPGEYDNDVDGEGDYDNYDDQYDNGEEPMESCEYGSKRSSARGSKNNSHSNRSRGQGGTSSKYHDKRSERRTSRSPSSRSRKSSRKSNQQEHSNRRSEEKKDTFSRSKSKSSPHSKSRRQDPDERSKPVTIPAPEAWAKSPHKQDNHNHHDPIDIEYDYDKDDESQTLPRDMTGASLNGADFVSTVSSMTSTDSYVKKQYYLRELRRQEFEARRRERVEQKKQAELDGHYDDDNLTQVVEEEECDMSYFPDSFCEEDNVRSYAKDGGDEDAYYDDRKRDSESKKDPPGKNHRSSSRSEGASHAHSNSRSASRSRHSSSEHSGSHRKNHNRSSRNNDDPDAPRVQREECCIKHPHIYLSDQTDVNVWTCLRYCKDPDTGRWITKKMVCEECLEEDEEVHHDEPEHHRRFRMEMQGFQCSRRNRLHLDALSFATRSTASDDEEECSSDEEEGSSSQHHHHDAHFHSSSRHKRSSSHHHANAAHQDKDHHGHLFDQEHLTENFERIQHRIRETINVHPSMGDDQTPLEREAEAQKRRFVRRLAARAYHFPGNTWCEDWIQYTSNTHLVFGIFFHHPLHPVTGRERCVILLGSVAVGLLMSNLIYLWFVHAEYGMDDTVLSLGPSGSFDVTKLMITLWTLGSVAHTLFDLSIWHIKACTFCRYSSGYYVSDGAVKCGRTAGMTIVLATFAFATYLVLLRASEDSKDSEFFTGHSSEDVDTSEDGKGESFIQPISLMDAGAKHFDFLLGYIVEFILAVFVYNPLILTIVFTGVLGCNGRMPVLGGRPREVMREQRHAMKRQRYTMPQVLKLGDMEYEADIPNQKLATNF